MSQVGGFRKRSASNTGQAATRNGKYVHCEPLNN